MSIPVVNVEVPGMRTHSLNVLLRMHWRTRSKLNHAQASEVLKVLKYGVGKPPSLPVRILLTRVANRSLDGHDNLQGSLKHVADTIAKWLDSDDADPLIKWDYAQEPAPYRHYSVRIQIESTS